MTAAELDEIMYKWPSVIQAAKTAGDGWAQGVALSIQRQARNPKWRPSAKQAALMRQAVTALFDDDGEAALIEELTK